jgi:glycogen(starch) synthase
VDRLYRAADVCVMPSVSEPLGLVALESLRNGTPCIIPKTAGVAEVLRHAMRVDYWDVDDMADKVIGLLEHPQLWEELSDGGLDEVRDARLGLDEAARRTGEAYAVALGRGLSAIPESP